MGGMTCPELHDAAPELALGILSGDARARALAHLETCADCQAEVEALTQVADGLVDLTPDAEPPVGFEERAMSRFGASRRPAPAPAGRPRRRWAPVAAAAAVVFGVGGWAIGGYVVPSHPAPAVRAGGWLMQAPLTAGSARVGQLFAYSGNPAWVYMQVSDVQATGAVTCELRQADGHLVRVGWFTLSADGYGYWGAPIPVAPSTVAGARLVDAAGSVVAVASFPHRSG